MSSGRRKRARRRAVRTPPVETPNALAPAVEAAPEPGLEAVPEPALESVPEPAAAESSPVTAAEPVLVPAAAVARPPRHTYLAIAAIVVGVVVLVAVIAYAAAGYQFASGRIDSATNAYNVVVSHQNTITADFNSINSKVTPVGPSNATSAELKQSKAAFATLVSQSRAAQPTLAADYASLAAAQARLEDSSWLTFFSRSTLDHVSAKIGHERNAVASAKTITGDMAQLGTFFQAYDDALIDLNALDARAQASDLAGAASVLTTLKTDVARAMELSSAPGLPPEMRLFLTDVRTLSVDEGKLLDAAMAGDTSTVAAEAKAISADAAKLDAYDFDKIATAIKSFYQPYIDTFNSEIARANAM